VLFPRPFAFFLNPRSLFCVVACTGTHIRVLAPLKGSRREARRSDWNSKDQGKEWLQKLPGLLLCSGRVRGGGVVTHTGEARCGGWIWGSFGGRVFPDLTTRRFAHACCAVRGGVVVLGGLVAGHELTASVETLGRGSSGAVGNIFKFCRRYHAARYTAPLRS
jgi:hypothetical protein